MPSSAEVSNAAPYVKAAVRDMKAYRDSKNYRKIPIGYSAGIIYQSPFGCLTNSNTLQPTYPASAPCYRTTSPAATTMPNEQTSTPSTFTNGAAAPATTARDTRSSRRTRPATTSPSSSPKRAAACPVLDSLLTNPPSSAQTCPTPGPAPSSTSGYRKPTITDSSITGPRSIQTSRPTRWTAILVQACRQHNPQTTAT